jgi:hypothetical protein
MGYIPDESTQFTLSYSMYNLPRYIHVAGQPPDQESILRILVLLSEAKGLTNRKIE